MVPNRTRICQLIVEQLESEPTLEIATAFQGQTRPSGEKKQPFRPLPDSLPGIISSEPRISGPRFRFIEITIDYDELD